MLESAYNALDPNGNITIKWDVMPWTPDGYVMVTETFGDMLFTPDAESLSEFRSPESLKRRVTISTKPPKEYLKTQESKAGTMGSHRENESAAEAWGGEIPSFKSRSTADFKHEDLEDEYEEEEDFQDDNCAPEYRNFIAIHAGKGKGGLDDWLKVEPDKVGRLSLSEQALEKAAKTHGPQIVRSTADFKHEDLEDEYEEEEDFQDDNCAPEYRNFIAIHAGKGKGGLDDWLKVEPDKVGRLSLSEQALEKAAKTHGPQIVRFTQTNILRVHPKGIRFDSSNYNPLNGWIHGAQMVAFNRADAISDMQVTLGESKEATVGDIMKHEKSAVAIFSQLKRHRNQAAHFRDVLGVAATLGKVMQDNMQDMSEENTNRNTWRKWIMASLKSSRASILVNGSPTSEFSLKRGLGEGDPLSSFLFIIVMEDLHIALKNGLTVNLFQGVKIGSSEIRFSHLFYADDVIILSEWNQCDMDNIICILNVFYLASGLKINISKSNLYGVGVSSDDIESMAAGTGCSASNLPFSYLGLPIGSNMNRIANWNSLIERFKIRLSGWKANMLSSGGRLTLIKSVLGSLGIYYFSIFKVPEAVLKTLESLRASFFWGATGDSRKLAWIKWSNILASLDKGGLGVGSLKAFNNSLLLKWRWRLLNKPSALWVEVLKSIHGNEAGIELKGCQTNGLWARIVGMIYHLHSSGYVPLNSLRYQVGDDSMIRFWKDTWLGDAPLCSCFNRLFRLEKNQNCLVRDRIVNGLWAWDWRRPVNGGRALADLNNLLMDIDSLNVEVDRDCVVSSLSTDGSYSVSFIRKHIDNCIIANSLPSTRWCKIISRKVNIFMWRLLHDRLPHRLNLSSRCLDINSILCLLPIFGGLFVVGVTLKSRRYLPVMNGTYGTPRGKLQKSRKTELMLFLPPVVGCFGVLGITTFSILKT
ncbi:RNA-directed DNA polymerase, eukaryota, reverse transcriptase zinc-binding domain protein [Tanacetum coccineum]